LYAFFTLDSDSKRLVGFTNFSSSAAAGLAMVAFFFPEGVNVALVDLEAGAFFWGVTGISITSQDAGSFSLLALPGEKQCNQYNITLLK
jgi:hypothetical protein